MTVTIDMQKVYTWLAKPQVQECARQCKEKAIAVAEDRLNMRVPKTKKERLNGFAAWLLPFYAKTNLVFLMQFEREFLSAAQLEQEMDAATGDAFKNAALAHLSPQLQQEAWQYFYEKLVSYAVLSQAIAWGRKNIGDAGLYGQPHREKHLWRVTLGIAGHGENLGWITLDADGNIIEDQSSTQAQLLEKIHSTKPPADKIVATTNATG